MTTQLGGIQLEEQSAPSLGLRWERRRLLLVYVDLVPGTEGEPAPRFDPRLEMFIAKAQNFDARVLEVSPTGIVAVLGVNSVEDQPRKAAAVAITILKTAERAATAAGQLKAVIHVDEFLIGRRADPQAILLTAVAAPLFQPSFRVVPLGDVQHPLGPIHQLLPPP